MTGFPFSMTQSPRFTGAVPEAVDVVVIGGGIIGVMSAWYLVGRGLSVLVAEKGRIACEQSSRNWGWIRQQGRDPAELPIMMEANRIWQGLEQECGERFGFQKTGVTYLARDEAEMAPLHDWLSVAAAHGLDTRVLGREQIAELMPRAAAQWVGGIHTASDARAEPWQAVPALALAAARRGVTIREECAVRSLDIQAGRIAGVVTEHRRVRCEQVVLAGGAWSSLFVRQHGVRIPQLAVVSSVVATDGMDSLLEGAISEKGFAMRRRSDGGYTMAPGGFHELFVGPDAIRHLPKYLPQLRDDPFGTRLRSLAPRGYPDAWRTARRWSAGESSPFERLRILDPRPNKRAIEGALARFAEIFPGLGRPRPRLAWAGMIDTMPDVVPILDHTPDIPGLVIATGMSGHGFGIGPAIGKVVADLVTGRPVGHDLRRFRFARFSDGSPIQLGPSL
jgi:glycine/D-amino acid oxidase-like deaminating enzyme